MRPAPVPAVTAALVLAILVSGVGTLAGSDNRDRWRAFEAEHRDLLRRGTASQKMLVLEEFASEDYEEASAYLLGLVRKAREPATALKAAEILGGHRNETALRLVGDPVRATPAADPRLLRAFFLQDHRDAPEVALSAILESRDPAVRTLAIPVAIRADPVPPTLVRGLTLLVGEEHPPALRRAAADALGRIPDPAGIPLLIRALEDPLLEEPARNGLLRLTGQEHWTDADSWRTWWAKANAGGDYAPAVLPDPDFAVRHAKLLEENGDGFGGGVAAMFYGRKVTGKNLLFLLDASASMRSDGRIERLRDELGTMLPGLSPRRRFGFVLFPIETWPNGPLVPATEENVVRAIQYANFIRPDANTPMMAAFRHAFEKVVDEERVDTLYLLSDGQPTDYPPHRVREEVLEYNERRGVTIHTISLGGEGRELLEIIARENGGEFWEAP